jgi:hypothetical protein
MTTNDALVTRRDPTADAALKALRAAYARGTPWVGRGEVVKTAGLSDGQAHAALCQLAVDALAQRGLFDDGRALVVRWKGLLPARTKGQAASEMEAAE